MDAAHVRNAHATINPSRLRAQRLVPKSGASVSELVRGVAGIQAQEIPAALWSIGTRSTTCTAADIDKARVQERSILLTWAMRGTRHFVATEDAAWLLPLLAPRTVAGGQRRNRDLGLDEKLFAAAVPMIRDFVAENGAATRSEIGAMLNGDGIDTTGQRLIHLIARATLERALCFGPDRDGEETWVALEDWVTIRWEEGRLDRLARRYLAAYAPATVRDFAAWAGLPLAEARRGFEAIAGDVVEVESESGKMMCLKESYDEIIEHHDTRLAVARLLPRYDTLLMGYRSRDWLVDEAHARHVHPGGGILHATLLFNGRAAGTWSIDKKGGKQSLKVKPFAPLSPESVTAIKLECEAMGAFWELPSLDLTVLAP